MAKDFEVKFKIGGALSSSFGSAFNGASKTIQNFNKNVDQTKKKLKGLQELSQKGLMFAVAGAAALTIPVKLAIDAESAMAEFGKVFDGTDAELNDFRKKFLRISSETGKSFSDVTLIAAAAAQASIAAVDLEAFTEDAIRMGIAFDMTAEAAGQSMAELRVQFKLSQDGVREFADKVNYLGNTTPNASNKILEITQRVGSLGKLANYTEGQLAALGASVVGMQPEVVATGLKGVIYALSAGEGATKSQRAAYAKLGLTAEKVNKSMQKDAERTTLTVLAAIKSLPKEDQANVLTSLFGKEGVGVTSQLVDNLGDVQKNLVAISEQNRKVWENSMLDEYTKRSKTTELALARMRESWKNVGIAIGSTLLPAVADFSDSMTKVATRVAEWTEKNPELAATLTKVAVAAVAIIGGISALSIGLITIVGPIMMAVNAIKMIGTAFAFVSRLFLLNPIGLAITAIIAVIYLLYKNWDTVVAFVSAGWEKIKSAGSAVMTWFQGLPAKFTEFGRNIIQGLVNGITGMAKAAVDAASNVASSIANKVKSFFGINSPSKLFMQYGEWNMQGLANGMSQSANLPKQAANDAAMGTVPAMPKPMNMRNNSSGGTVLQLTQHITLGAGATPDMAQQARQGAAAGANDMLAAWEQAQARKARLAF